jgi:multiple sugar transport system substrate-binding protein
MRRWPQFLLVVLISLACVLGSVAREKVEPVSVLMPASFADATAPLVRSFNRSHPGINLTVTRGPLSTESVSDLAISSLLLADSPYDLLLMDVTWTQSTQPRVGLNRSRVGWVAMPSLTWLRERSLATLSPATSGAIRLWPTWGCSTGAPI